MSTIDAWPSPIAPLPPTNEDSLEANTRPAAVPDQPAQGFRKKWFAALKEIGPIYIAVHLAFFVISYCSVLLTIPDFARRKFPLSSIWTSWHHWDTGIYMAIARYGYDTINRTAFFPLYPILEAGLSILTRDPFTAGLIISNVAGLVLLTVLYQLVKEDFHPDIAARTVLYLSVFPTAFFLASGYNESLFICLTVLCFYNLRHGQWWLAALCGFLASLTRSSGMLLVVPFCYEYVRHTGFEPRHYLRPRTLAILLIPLGTLLFAIFCYLHFQDFLAFAHVEPRFWNRELRPPGWGFFISMKSVLGGPGLLSFQSTRNLTDLLPDLLVGAAIVLIFIGPWRFPKKLWSYGVLAALLFVYFTSFPAGSGGGLYPIQSSARYALEVFPAFIILARIGTYRLFHLNYLMISSAMLFFLLTSFLVGRWVL